MQLKSPYCQNKVAMNRITLINAEGLLLGFVTSILILPSCSDPCKKIDCYKGFCEKGRCICYEGWTGARCDIQECSALNCINGTCINNTCECDYGWTGDKCDQQKPLRFIYIDSIRVKHRYFNYNDGLFDNYPDIYIKVYDGSGLFLYETATEYDAYPNELYTFDLTVDNVYSSNVSGIWEFKIYDRDANTADDLLLTISSELYGPNHLPRKTAIITSDDPDLLVEIYVRYIY